jgi:prevent-host-death family protein
MKTATVRELRNRYTSLLRWVGAGEEILITRRGKPVARLVPEKRTQKSIVNWAQSHEVKRDRSAEPVLSAKAVASLLAESSGSC